MTAVVWNPLDSNLNAVLSADQLTATPFLSGPLARMWCGLRASAGLKASKAAFTVHVHTNPALVGKAAPQYLCMIGVSTQETDICQLGEAAGSWGYGSPGRKSSSGVFAQYGRTFGPGDTVTCYVNTEAGSVSYAVNGAWLGEAFTIPKDQPVFPHALAKNAAVTASFDTVPEVDTGLDTSSFLSWQEAARQGHCEITLPDPLPDCLDFEVLTLVGLPGCGKTTWAKKVMAEDPGKQYVLLSAATALQQMRVDPKRKRNATEQQHYAKLLQLATSAARVLAQRAVEVPRNYILDLPCFDEARRNQIVAPFNAAGFKSRAAVFMLPDNLLAERRQMLLEQEGRSAPDTVLADAKASLSIPAVGDDFEEVFFAENHVSKAARAARRSQAGTDQVQTAESGGGSEGGQSPSSGGSQPAVASAQKSSGAVVSGPIVLDGTGGAAQSPPTTPTVAPASKSVPAVVPVPAPASAALATPAAAAPPTAVRQEQAPAAAPKQGPGAVATPKNDAAKPAQAPAHTAPASEPMATAVDPAQLNVPTPTASKGMGDVQVPAQGAKRHSADDGNRGAKRQRLQNGVAGEPVVQGGSGRPATRGPAVTNGSRLPPARAQQQGQQHLTNGQPAVARGRGHAVSVGGVSGGGRGRGKLPPPVNQVPGATAGAVRPSVGQQAASAGRGASPAAGRGFQAGRGGNRETGKGAGYKPSLPPPMGRGRQNSQHQQGAGQGALGIQDKGVQKPKDHGRMAGGRGATAQAPSNGQQALHSQSQQQGQGPQPAIKAASSVTQAQQQRQRRPVGRPVQSPRVSVPQSHRAGQGSASNKAGTAPGPVPQQLLQQQQQQQAGARSAGSSGGGRGILPRPAPPAGLQASQLQGGPCNQRVGLERYATASPRVAALQPQSASQQGSWYSPAGAGQLAAGSMPMQGGFAAGSMPMPQQQRAGMGLQAASSGPVQSGYVAAFVPPQQQPHTPGLSAPASQVLVGGDGGYAMNPQLQQQLPAGQGFQQQAGVQGFVMDGFQGLSQAASVPQQQQVIMSAPQQGLGSGSMVVGGSSPGYNLAAMDGYQQGQGFAANPAGVPVPAPHHHQHAAQDYAAAATGGTGTGWADQMPQQLRPQAMEYMDQDQAQGFVAQAAGDPAAAAGQQPGAFGLPQGQGQGYAQHITGAGMGTGQGGQVAYAQGSSQGYQQGFGGPQAPLAQTQFSTPGQQSGSFVAQGLQGSQYQGTLTSQTQPQFTQGAMQGSSSHFNSPGQGNVDQQKQFATQGYGQGQPQNFSGTTQQLGSQHMAGMQQGGWQQQGAVYSSGMAPQQQQQQQQQAQFGSGSMQGTGPQHLHFAGPSAGAGMGVQQQHGHQGTGGSMLGTGLGPQSPAAGVGGQQQQPHFGGPAARTVPASRFAGGRSGGQAGRGRGPRGRGRF